MNDDKNPVIALREIADKTVPPEDLREALIHSIQKNVEVDEPEAAAAPLLPPDRRNRPMLGRDDQSSDHVVDVMTEEQLLRGLESMTPTEPSANGGPTAHATAVVTAIRGPVARDGAALAMSLRRAVPEAGNYLRGSRPRREERRAMMRQYELVERVLRTTIRRRTRRCSTAPTSMP